jgi:hypothetical protein
VNEAFASSFDLYNKLPLMILRATMTYKEVQKRLHNAIYVCINDTGVPKSLVERPEFRAMIQVACQSGELKPDDSNLGRDLYKTIENEHIERFCRKGLIRHHKFPCNFVR